MNEKKHCREMMTSLAFAGHYLVVFPGRVEPPGARGASGGGASCGRAVTGHLTPGEVSGLTAVRQHLFV